MRIISTIGATALAASLAIGAPARAAPDAAKIADAVKADVHQLIADFNAHDAAKAVGHDGAGYVGMFHGMPNVVGTQADLAVTRQQVADPAATVQVSDESVDVAEAGDMAIYRATYRFAFTDPKTRAPTAERGNWILAYKPQTDGSWKLAWSVVSDTGPTVAKP